VSNTIQIEDMMRKRLERRVPWEWLKEREIDRVYVGGGCMNRGEPNDIDLFPVRKDQFKGVDTSEAIAVTASASTFIVGKTPVQLCNYHHNSLEELVKSFDFAHIQIGARVHVATKNVEQLYYTDDWSRSHALETTWYTGSAYPLSSLIRLIKYIKRDLFPGRSYIMSIVSILNDVIERGYENYGDFKDQLDAIDLGLLEDEYSREDLLKLFSMLRKDAEVPAGLDL